MTALSLSLLVTAGWGDDAKLLLFFFCAVFRPPVPRPFRMFYMFRRLIYHAGHNNIPAALLQVSIPQEQDLEHSLCVSLRLTLPRRQYKLPRRHVVCF